MGRTGLKGGSQELAARESSGVFPKPPGSCSLAPRFPSPSPRAGTSNCWHFLRMMLTSLACRGAAFCLTRRQSFLVLSQCSGRSCSEHCIVLAVWPQGTHA